MRGGNLPRNTSLLYLYNIGKEKRGLFLSNVDNFGIKIIFQKPILYPKTLRMPWLSSLYASMELPPAYDLDKHAGKLGTTYSSQQISSMRINVQPLSKRLRAWHGCLFPPRTRISLTSRFSCHSRQTHDFTVFLSKFSNILTHFLPKEMKASEHSWHPS